MNLKLFYLYRDAGNYKNFGEVVFENATGLTPTEVEVALRDCMIDKGWFVADHWGLPDLHFKEYDWDSELDHDWHEYEGVEETNEASTNGSDIVGFVSRVKALPNAPY